MGLVLLGSAAFSGCYLSHRRAAPEPEPGDAGTDATVWDAGADGGADATTHDAGVDAWVLPPDCDAGTDPDPAGPPLVLDMLFVVDDSLSMSEEQAALTRRFSAMVSVLVTGDLDGDGRADFQPVDDLRVGVVTTTVDVGVTAVPSCAATAVEGDDGILRTAGDPFSASCSRSYPSFLSFRPGVGDSSERFVRDFACVATVGTQGCGFEQPLEAALKALTPADAPIEFLAGRGQADGANAGFLREDSVLAVVVVTDEDDCSTRDAELFNPESERYPAPDRAASNLRCFTYPEALHPVERFVVGLTRLRRPDSFVFAAIAGVPPDLVSDPEHIDYEALLADPRMQERIDPEHPTRLRPACDVVGTGFAQPSRRIVSLASALGDNAVVQSVCDDSFVSALSGVTSRLAEIIRRRRCR